MRKISKSDEVTVVALVLENALSYTDIGRKFGVTPTAIHLIAKKHGAERSKLGLPRVHKHPTEMSADYLRAILDYDPKSGHLRWRKNNKIAGWTDDLGYIHVRIGRTKLYLAHRLAWLHFHGAWPAENIDHINGQPSDNRIENLRECTQAQNCRNTKLVHATSKFRKGVCYDPKRKKFRAYIRRRGGKHGHLGRFDTLEEAIAAREEAERRLHGAFVRRE